MLENKDELTKEINALALSNDIFLFADADGYDSSLKSGKNERLNRLEACDSITFYFNKSYREIENFLPNKVWEKTLIEFCDKRELKKGGKKEEIEEKIIEQLKNHESKTYKLKYIGEFLSKLDIPSLNKIYEDKKGGLKGTFIYKRELSELVLQKTISGELTWEDFKKSPGIVKLTKELVKFLEA